jgi:hypothetical protein
VRATAIEGNGRPVTEIEVLTELHRDVEALLRRIGERYWPAIEKMQAAGYGGAELMVDGDAADLAELAQCLERTRDTAAGMFFAGGDKNVFTYWFHRHLARGDEDAALREAAQSGADELGEYLLGEATVAARKAS